MKLETFRPEGVAVPAVPYSSVVASGDLVYTAGQVGQDADGVIPDDFGEQVRQVFKNLERCLAAAGCGFGDVIKVNAYLTDLANFPTFNAIYQEYLQEPYPARTTVGAALVRGFQVEIEMIARRPS
jgi:2-iminobutanoate/2-iminopropanoate deaminase